MYQPPAPYTERICGGVFKRDTRRLDIPIRVITLPPGYSNTMQKMFPNNMLPTTIGLVAEECGAERVGMIRTSRDPKREGLETEFARAGENGDERLSIALEGNGWSVPTDVAEKICERFALPKEAIEPRYPVAEFV